jgi:hypothetical protein
MSTTTLEFVITQFNIIYPKKSTSLKKIFEEFIEFHSESAAEILEASFLHLIATRLRVEEPDSDKSFLENLELLKDVKLKLGTVEATVGSVPGFITKNILTMPSNRGYIWMDVKFFGKQKKTRENNTVLFEPRKGKTFIHVRTDSTYKLYEKLKGETTQTMIKSEILLPVRNLPIIRERISYRQPSQPVVEPETSQEQISKHQNPFLTLDDSDSEKE